MKIKKAIFMLRKLLRDLNTNRKIEINMENQSETLGYYYIKFDEDPSDSLFRQKWSPLEHDLY